MKKVILMCILFMQVNTYPNAQDNNSFSVQLAIENGIIEGNYDTHTGIQKYFGIPFAKPPIGDLRWKPPQPLDNWEGVKETKKFGPRPMQNYFANFIKTGDPNGAGLPEWLPAAPEDKNPPVMIIDVESKSINASDDARYEFLDKTYGND